MSDKAKARKCKPERIILLGNGLQITITVQPAAGPRRRWPDDFILTKTRRPSA
jgi:hypothetical protein